ncbi:MAG: hypothetical protein IJN03_01515 [Bacilli bacterium]|nr:hypothetical protein [Bacilli bacterium]
MKKFFKFFGLCAIMLFSFFYTEKIALYVQNKSPIMTSINDAKNNLFVSSIDAEVINEYIIPGINGLAVNVKKSYDKMKSFEVFNSYYLVFDQVPPEISLENNKNKIIKKGNKLKKSVSFILEDNSQIINYLKENNIKANILMNIENYQEQDKLEIINSDVNNFEKLESLLNKAKLNKHICYVEMANKEKCIEKENYLVSSSMELNSVNLASIKKRLESGDIILIKSTAKLEDFILLINQIKYQDLKIVYLSELITEENN